MRNFCVCKSVATFILVAILVGCGQIVSPKVDGIQSITFVSEQSEDGSALAYYSEEYDGTIVPGEMTLTFSVLPTEFADILASEWKTSLSVKIKYSKPQSSIDGEYGDLSILGVSSPSEGRLTVRTSCENIDKSFFKKELSANVVLMAVFDGVRCPSFDGVRCSSGFIPVIPYLGVDETGKIYIPDPNLKSLLLAEYDSNGDGVISVIEAEAITSVICEGRGISDLTGLESCPNLTIINCSGNNISTLSLHDLPQLTYIDCSKNRLQTLTVSGPPALETLVCEDNKLVSLNIAQNESLKNLDCSGNSIASLNLSGLTKLKELNASSNTLETLDLSGCASLTSIDCSKNRLQTLTVSGSLALETLVCEDNNLVLLNIEQNRSLKNLDCSGNSIASLDLSNCRLLEELDCSGNALSALDVKNNTALKTLDISGNRDISLVDLSNNPALEDLDASCLSISELDLTAITQLKTLYVTGNANLTRVICPSQRWLDSLSRIVNDMLLSYVDLGEAVLYDGAATVNVDGLAWASYNVGWSPTNLYGETYTFDDAQKVCPNSWRTPTRTEIESLSMNFSSEVTVNGMQGRWFSGSKTYSESVPAIFLPYKKGSSGGHYWSSTDGSSYAYAYFLYFSGRSSVGVSDYFRSYTYSVRCLKN